MFYEVEQLCINTLLSVQKAALKKSMRQPRSDSAVRFACTNAEDRIRLGCYLKVSIGKTRGKQPLHVIRLDSTGFHGVACLHISAFSLDSHLSLRNSHATGHSHATGQSHATGHSHATGQSPPPGPTVPHPNPTQSYLDSPGSRLTPS